MASSNFLFLSSFPLLHLVPTPSPQNLGHQVKGQNLAIGSGRIQLIFNQNPIFCRRNLSTTVFAALPMSRSSSNDPAIYMQKGNPIYGQSKKHLQKSPWLCFYFLCFPFLIPIFLVWNLSQKSAKYEFGRYLPQLNMIFRQV